MKVLVVAPHAVMNATFETDLEIMQTHLDANDEVTILGCDADVPACDPNVVHDLGLCLRCISRRKAGLEALTAPVSLRKLINLRPEDKAEIARLPKSFADLDALRAFYVEEFDAGWGVLSTIASFTRDPAPDMTRQADLVHRLLMSAVGVYRSVQNHIDALKPDRVYAFNGRFALMRAAFRAAQSRGVDCFLQDRGASFRHYRLFKNRMPHDPPHYQALIKEFWAAGNEQERTVMGASFFIEFSVGVCQFYTTYTDQQNKDELPVGWDATKNNVVVYTSSDDEWVAIGDMAENPIYKDQYDGLLRIVESVRGDDSLHLYIRMHPNLRKMKQGMVQNVLAISSPNVTVIAPDSPISTYALMRNATRVVTFGSTTGIEAVYWGKPSILAGASFYGDLGGTYNPKSHGEVVSLLKASLAPKSKDAALMFGYFARMHGLRFRHFQPVGIPGGPFRGRMLQPDMKTRFAARALESKIAGTLRKVHLRLVERRLTT